MERVSHGFASALLTVACCWTASADEPIEDEPIEEALSARWTAAYNEGDIEALAAMYSPDARLQHGYCPSVTGRQAIEDFWRTDTAEGKHSTTLKIIDSFVEGEVAYIGGTYTVTESEADEAESVSGRYMQIWRRAVPGDWTLHRESWINLACVQITPSLQVPGESSVEERRPDPTVSACGEVSCLAVAANVR